MDYTKPIELGIAEKLKKDEGYRRAFFRASATDSIALQIRQLRKLRVLKQAELAEAADMKQSAVSRIEQAEYSSWTFNTLWRVAEALNARLIVRFQPIESAIKEYEMSEHIGAALAKGSYYVSGETLGSQYSTMKPQTALPKRVSVSGSTAKMQAITIAQSQRGFVMNTGATNGR